MMFTIHSLMPCHEVRISVPYLPTDPETSHRTEKMTAHCNANTKNERQGIYFQKIFQRRLQDVIYIFM